MFALPVDDANVKDLSLETGREMLSSAHTHADSSPRWNACSLILTLLLFPFAEQQDSMATTVAVSPSEYLQPSTASSQVSNKGLSLPSAHRIG